MRQPVVGTVMFFLAAPGTVAGLVPWLISRWVPGTPLLGARIDPVAGPVVLACGLVALVHCFARFARDGQGTPAPVAPTQRLVVSGLYRYVRNPMYVAVLAIILGQALWLGSRALMGYGALLALVFHLFVVLYEEPSLRGRHGSDYLAYVANVRRWWPRRSPWSPVDPAVRDGR